VALAIEAFMLPAGAGREDRLMALWHPPAGAASRNDAGTWRGVVLYIHPFAEEMNKTRRMAALQARALAAAGYGVLQIDLKGCGDSSGEFGDASWSDWVSDVHTALRWLRERSSARLTVWGLRAGCLLLADAAANLPDDLLGETCDFIFWQPTPSGAPVLRQFLRTAAAAAFLDGGGKGVVDTLRKQLAAGQSVEVGGYRVHPALATGLERARLPVPARLGRLVWLECSATAGLASAHPPLTPASVRASAPWRQAAASFEVRLVPGPPFWQTAEIETAPALIEATLAAMQVADGAALSLV
jgi:exosortase A-associated hydrolase 2